MRSIILCALLGMAVFSCGGDGNPAGEEEDSALLPGAELLGRWRLIFSSDPDEQILVRGNRSTLSINQDGSAEKRLTAFGVTVVLKGKWSVEGDVLMTVLTTSAIDEPQVLKQQFMVGEDQITLVNLDSGIVEVWEKEATEGG